MPAMSPDQPPAESSPRAVGRPPVDRRSDPWFVYGTEQPADVALELLGEPPDSPGAERLRGGAGPGGIWWIDDVAARAEAHHARRNVVIDFWASWCPACLVMDHKTFSDTAVTAELSAYFVPVKLDVSEETEFNRARLRHYQVFSLPSILVVTPDGRELDRIKAFVDAEALIAWLSSLRGEVGPSAAEASAAPDARGP